MAIDFTATKKKIFDTGRTLSGWSRVHGLPRGSVIAILNNNFATNRPTEGVYARVIAALDSDGFLVRLPDDDQGQEQAA